MEIDEPGSSNVDLVNEIAVRYRIHYRLGDFAWVLANRFCQAHRNVGREVAVPWIASALNRCVDRYDIRRFR